MKSTVAFLSELNQQNIRLLADADQLHINAPKGALSPELTAELKARKGEILVFLRQNQSAPMTAQIQNISRSEPLPLSFSQQRLWFLEQLGSGATYTIPLAFQLLGELDIAALQQTLTEIVRRHESLRTSFVQGQEQTHQVIYPPGIMPLPLIDLQHVTSEKQAAEVARLICLETLKPFDLSADLMLRASLLRQASKTHVLLLTLHHIAADGWSLGVLVGELTALYKAFVQNNISPLPELPIQYADFAVWQRNRLQGELLEKQLSYWKKQLTNIPELLQLPLDYSRPPVQVLVANKLDFQIDTNLVQCLRQLSHQAGATLFMTLLAAFQVLLARYCGHDDIVVDSPIANRTQKAIEPLIGLFVNDLVLRADLSGNPSFLELLAQVRQTTLAAYEHQDLPFDHLVEALRLPRHLGYNPVTQVAFALQNAPMGEFNLSGVQVQPLDMELQQTRMDMEVHLWEREAGLEGTWIYNTRLFAADTIKRMAGHFQTLLAGIAADPKQRVADLPLLTAAEYRQVLLEWNSAETDTPNKCLHQLFEEQVERTPDAVAIVFANQQMTYRELNNRANQLAHALQAQGVGLEVMVGICMERSLEMVVGMLGILKAGGAYVPLDPAYPAERIAIILQEIATPILLTQERLLETLPSQQSRVIALDTGWNEIANYPATNPNVSVAPHHLAYVIYTSGSTGKPKGVLIEHQSVAAHCVQYQHFYTLTPADRVLQLASFHFDASVEQIFPALLTGACVILPEWELDPVSFSLNLQDFGVTVLDLAGVYLRLLLQEWVNIPALIAGSPLRIVVVGADVMPLDLVKLWRNTSLHRKARLFNVYGPTETTVAATVFEITDAFDSNQSRIPIGLPLVNKKLYVLDAQLQPVPVGVPGELYIGGIGPGRGYLNRPELTESRFVTLNFDLDDKKIQSRVYRTGDLVRWLQNGNIDFLGRIDQQVKIRGFRIELGEIEAVLNQHTAVQETAVIVWEDELGQKRLIAYLTPQLSDERIPELRNHLKKQLPDYMLPDAFIMLADFPKTPVGILDRKALPPPVAKLSTAPYELPKNATEQQIAVIWEHVLKRKDISIHDSFFDVGGHSLLVLQVHSLLRTNYPALRIVDLFSYPSIHTLAAFLDQKSSISANEQASQAHGAKRRARQLANQHKRQDPSSHTRNRN